MLTAMLLNLDGFSRHDRVSPSETVNLWRKLEDWEERWGFLDLGHDITLFLGRWLRSKTAPKFVGGWVLFVPEKLAAHQARWQKRVAVVALQFLKKSTRAASSIQFLVQVTLSMGLLLSWAWQMTPSWCPKATWECEGLAPQIATFFGHLACHTRT